MATHSNILAWRIPWTEEPGGLQSVGLPRIGHDLATKQQQQQQQQKQQQQQQQQQQRVPLWLVEVSEKVLEGLV